MKILTINASPVKNSSTEFLLGKISEGIESTGVDNIENQVVYLNDYLITPCQSCGENPEPDWCLYTDDIYPLYDSIAKCDTVLFGTPVYFDTVSAQAKLFIDRTNCMRPVDFNTGEFINRIEKKRIGAMVLVGGERQNFECARTVLAGFFKWLNIENKGRIIYAGSGLKAGAVKDNQTVLNKAFDLGRSLAARNS